MLSIYGHFGSHNHGNEAIIRGLSSGLHSRGFDLYSYYPDIDRCFNLNSLCRVKPFYKEIQRYSLFHMHEYILRNFYDTSKIVTKYIFAPFLHAVKKGLFLLEAGDQYCEGPVLRQRYAFLNNDIHNAGALTGMLPCTIDTNVLHDRKLLEDLSMYDYIFAREKITYEALINANIHTSIYYSPCPAFLMPPKECEFPIELSNYPIIGITVGELAQGKESFSKILATGIEVLIEYILRQTDFYIALIPHVNVAPSLTDINMLHNLFLKFSYTNRILEIPEHRADEQKYIISKCQMFITTRTHASIAAYSSLVPTLVISYSQKSRGLAQDIFGEYTNYIIPVECLENSVKLIKQFCWLMKNKDTIRNYLAKRMPDYIAQTNILFEILEKHNQ